MAHTTIYEKIENKGVMDAKQIISAGELQAKSLETTALEAANRQISTSLAKVIERNGHQLKTKTTEFEQAAKQQTLASKKALIEKALVAALAKMQTLTDAQWKTLVLQTLSTDELSGNEIIVAAKNDHSRFLSLFVSEPTTKYPVKLDLLNLALSGKKYDLTLAKKIAPIDGGFFVDGTDFDVDHSYATMLSAKKDQYESEIATILFDGRP